MYTLMYLALCAICFASAKIVLEIPASIIEKVLPIEEQCIKESGSIPDSFNRMLDFTLPHDEASKKFMWCFESKSGYFDKNAHFVIDKFIALMKNFTVDKDDFIKALKECNENTGDDIVELAYQMVVCYHQKSPYLFSAPK